MADQEVIKHTKKIYKVWNSTQHSWQQKLKEFLIEIMIIVFAVTLSIWLHGLSQKSHDREEIHSLMEGLERDMRKDVKEMEADTISYGIQERFLSYLAYLSPGATPDSAIVSEDDWTFKNRTVLIPNISRFEALRYSGLMGKVENKELLDEIISLYEETIPMLVQYAQTVSDKKIERLGATLDALYYPNGDKLKTLRDLILQNPRFVYQLQRISMSMNNVRDEYISAFKQYHKLIKLIGEELKK